MCLSIWMTHDPTDRPTHLTYLKVLFSALKKVLNKIFSQDVF